MPERSKGKNIIAGILFILTIFSCIPCYSTDYSKEENWAYRGEGDRPADVFFICPTVYFGTDKSFNMDLDDESTKKNFLGATNMEKGIYDKEARFFAPYYRQVGFNVYSMNEVEPYFDIAYSDVKDAFLYYLQNENRGHPFILAGFSQGADMCLRLLKDCFAEKKIRSFLIACYAIGWRVTKKELKEYPQLNFAKRAQDTGVIISFNSEAPFIDNSILIPKGIKTLCINPLNWSRKKPANKLLNIGACFTDYTGAIKKEIPCLTGAYIDKNRGALKIMDITPEEYPGILFEDGIYHLYDYQFFYRNLQENVRDRIKAYIAEKDKRRNRVSST